MLRALAATAVVFTHFQLDLGRLAHVTNVLPDMEIGSAGVDLFFVISGFVIVYASEKLFGRHDGPVRFFAHRVIRIVPLYWLVTALYVAMALAIPSFAKHYSATSVLASLFFVPFRGLDGNLEPIVGQGWTLNYEMMFYVIFALTVLGSRRVAVALASLGLLAAVIAGRIGQPTSDLLSYWSNPIVIEFLFGMAIALAYRDGFRLPQPVAVVAVLAGLAAVLIANAMVPVFETRVIFIGIPAAVMVAGATFGGFALRGPIWTALAVVGDASYALYLFHSFAVRGVILLSGRLGLDIARHPWPYLAAAVIGAIMLAVVLHYAFERPITRLLRRLTDRAPQVERRPQPVT